jgi:flagellar protein FliS
MTAPARQSKPRRQVETASKPELLDQLYARLLRDCQEARACAEKGDASGQAHAVHYALAIVSELAGALDHELAPDLCSNLLRLYEFCGDRLRLGQEKMSATPIEEAEQVITTLRAAFQEAARKAP